MMGDWEELTNAHGYDANDPEALDNMLSDWEFNEEAYVKKCESENKEKNGGEKRILLTHDGISIIKSIYFLVFLGYSKYMGTNIVRYTQETLKRIKKLLDTGANINTEDNFGLTALSIAVLAGDVELVKFLIDSGANVNHKHVAGSTLLDMCFMPQNTLKYPFEHSNYIINMQIEYGQNIDFDNLFKQDNSLKIAKILMNHGAILNRDGAWMTCMQTQDMEKIDFLIKNSDQYDRLAYLLGVIIYSSININNVYHNIQTPIIKEQLTQLPVEISSERYERLIVLLVDSGVDLNQKTDDGYTILMTAIMLKNIKIVNLLLNYEIDLSIKSNTGFRAIDYALENREIRTMLIKKGAKIDITKKDNGTQNTIGKEIQTLENLELGLELDFLQFNVPSNSKEIFSHGTPLTDAIKSKKVKDLKKAIQKNSNLVAVNVVDLVLHGYSKEFIDIVIKNGGLKNKQDEDGRTALMHACRLGKEKIVEVLIKNGANIDIVDNNDNDVWEYAAIAGQEEIFTILKNYDMLSKSKSHNPKALALLLKKFSLDDHLMYTNHPWDRDINYEDFIERAENAWYEIKSDLKVLSPSLYDYIEEFLFSESEEAIGFSSPSVRDELESGKKPDEINLENGITFQDRMNDFKSRIVVKQNDKKLKLLKIFTALKKELDLSIKLNLDNLKEDNTDKFFTDIFRLKSALRIILKDIDTHEDEDKEVVKVLAEDSNQFIEVKIIHVGSKSSKTAEKLEQTIDENGGNYKTIYDNLTSVCDWSVDTICQDGNRYKIDYLYPDVDNDKPHWQKIDQTIEGFTYILRFYK